MAMSRRMFSTWAQRREKSRYMRACSLYVQGLPWGMDDIGLRGVFEDFGDVVDCKVMMHPESGRSRGFGFVTFKREDEAKEALEAMDGKDVAGRSIRVDYARDGKEKKGSSAYTSFLDILSHIPSSSSEKLKSVPALATLKEPDDAIEI